MADLSTMDVRLRYFDGCPNWQTAEARLREALDSTSAGTGVEITLERVESDGEAQALRFQGSPTILLDGRDPFPAEESGFGLTCRLYRTEAGLEGSPSLSQLRMAVADQRSSESR
jgi:hypothetical protein